MAQPAYGARNLKGAGSPADATTTTVYSIAPKSSRTFTVWATDEFF